MSKEEKSGGLFSSFFTKKPPKGVTKQRGKSKDRYHEDPPEPLPEEYDSEEDIRAGHHDPKVTLNETKYKVKGLFKGPSDRSNTQRDFDDHHPKHTKSSEKGGGRETPKKSKIESLFGSSDDGKSRKKKSQDRYHQKNPYEKYEKGESKGGKSGGKGGGGGGGLFSGIGSGSGGGGGGTSGKTKVKLKGRSTSRQSKGGASGGFSIPSF